MAMILQLDSVNRWLGDGVTTDWDFSFSGGYIDRAHVKTYVQDADGVRVYHEPEFITGFRVRILPAAPAGSTVTIFRFTPRDLPLVEFEDGTAITEPALNLMARQAVFIAAEFTDATTTTIDDGALEPYGFKDMKHITYAGASTVNLGDRGRNHVKTDHSQVTVPAMYVGFSCNIFNVSEDDMPVTFALTAYHQGSSEVGTSWTLAPNSILHMTQVSSTKVFISGNAA